MKCQSFSLRWNTLLISAFILLIGLSAAHAQNFPTAEVSYAGASEEGTILLEVVSYGRKAHIAMEEGQRKAFFILLYRGIPGSQYSNPLIADEVESLRNHKFYYEEFFQHKRYRTFMMDSYAVSKFKKKQMITLVKINVDALRRDLEQNKVVRKFGL